MSLALSLVGGGRCGEQPPAAAVSSNTSCWAAEKRACHSAAVPVIPASEPESPSGERGSPAACFARCEGEVAGTQKVQTVNRQALLWVSARQPFGPQGPPVAAAALRDQPAFVVGRLGCAYLVCLLLATRIEQ